MSEIPLIAARCKRCGRIAARYWLAHGEGEWLTAAQIRVAADWVAEHPHDQAVPVFDEHGRVSAAERDVVVRRVAHELRDLADRRVVLRVCDCDPPPTLPQGEQLAKLVARARCQLHPSRARDKSPLVIRVPL